MKKLILAAIIIFGYMLSGCQDVLDTKPGNTYSEVDIYSNIDLTKRLVYYSYGATDTWGVNLSQWWTRIINLECASDEAFFHFKQVRYKIFPETNGALTPSNLGLAFKNSWKTYYSYIRSCDEFLDKIDDASVMNTDKDMALRLKGEAQFLRAFCYTKLVRYYGGVPIIEKPFTLSDTLNIPRNSYEECIDFIVTQLDEAAAVLPEYCSGDEFGRVDQRAALALKARVLLYAASKLHDPSTVPNGPLYDYSKSSKWQDASDAAKAVIDLPSNAEGLIQVADYKEYKELFLAPNKNILFARPFNQDYATFSQDIYTLPDQAQSPIGFSGWGVSNPTQNFVDLFKMNNGKSITDPTSGYDPSAENIYKNRDMRFYADILYNGAEFRDRKIEFFRYGRDSKDIGDMAKHYCITGYNMRKFIDESIDFSTSMSPKRPYIMSRLAEIYLDYAEAEYHLGHEDIARQYVSKVAERAHQPAITTSGEELLEDIKNERAIELCYEGHRYFDLRRWMDTNHLGGDIRGIEWAYYKEDGSIAGIDPSTGEIEAGSTLKYTSIPKIENRPWKTAYYYLPIPQGEITKANKLVQNYDY